MNSPDYIVTAALGSRTRKIVWHPDKPLPLHPLKAWKLERRKDGIWISGHDASTRQRIDDYILNGKSFEVTQTLNGKVRKLVLTVRPLKRINPVFFPPNNSTFSSPFLRPNQLFVFYGVDNHLVTYDPGGDHYRGYLEGRPVFAYLRGDDIFKIVAFREGVVLKPEGEPAIPIKYREPHAVSDKQLTEGSVCWGKHWWRVTRLPMPETIPLRVVFEEELRESQWFRAIAKTVASMYLVFALAVLIYPHAFLVKKPPEPPVQVTLKAPKIIPKTLEMPKPPEPPPKKIEVAKPEIKPVQKPLPKNAPPPPPKVAAKPTPTPPKPATPAPSVVAQQQLAKSLSFLSPSANKPKGNIAAPTTKYSAADMSLISPKDTSALKNMTTKDQTGPIDTKNSREISGDVSIKTKGLNHVMGKVALNTLYSNGSGSDMSGALGNSTGMSLGGEGKIPEALIQKTLAKYMERFQYCYEKALMTDAGLAGNVVLQWTINTSGSPTEIKVVRSQINNSALHNCLSQEIGRIHFPQPTGGPVVIKFPFAFSSSSL